MTPREQRHRGNSTKARVLTATCVWLAVATSFGLAEAARAQSDGDGPLVIRAAQLVAADGTLRADALVVIDGGRFKQVGGEVPRGAEVREFDGVLCPGLVDVYGTLATRGPVSENDRPLEAGARAADLLDRHSPEIRRARAAGVTTFAIVPGEDDLVGGQVAIAMARADDAMVDLLDGHALLSLSLSPSVFKMDRPPTSRSGAIGMLRRTLASASSDKQSPLAAFVAGKQAGIIVAPYAADVLAILRLHEDYPFKAAIVHENDARDVAAMLAEAHVPVIVGPLGVSTTRRVATAAGVLEHAGVEVAIAGGFPQAPADALRIGANIAAANGMSIPAARRAITIAPAEMLGVADRVGSIERGKRADLVVFSGDPLDVRSRVLAVFAGGVRVSE